MKKLMDAPNVVLAQHWLNILQHAGVGCEMHNRYLQGALGDIPYDQCRPEIWLADEREEKLARRLIATAISGPPPGSPAWRCAGCGEMLEAQFTVCWQCATVRDPLNG
jgi:hypothetical protein